MAVLSVSDLEFSREVLQHHAPVVVAFRGEWCALSQQLAPLVDAIAANFEGRVKVAAVDVESDPKANKICRQYNITRLPVVMVFRDGRVVDFIGGAASPDNVAEMIDRQLQPVLDVNEYNFDAEVLQAEVPVLVHVDAEWCVASRVLVPVVESMAERFRGRAKVVRLEFGAANAALCGRYGFLRVPTLALFLRGQVEDQIFGPMQAGTKSLTSADNVAQMVEQFVL
jgi:thioredoxin 1